MKELMERLRRNRASRAQLDEARPARRRSSRHFAYMESKGPGGKNLSWLRDRLAKEGLK